MIHLLPRTLVALAGCLVLFPLVAQSPERSLYYVSLESRVEGKTLTVTPHLTPFLEHTLLAKEPYGFSENLKENLLDGPMRRVWFVLNHLDKHRDSVFPDGPLKQPEMFYRMVVGLTLRNDKGRPLRRRAHRIRLGVSDKPGFLVVATPEQEKQIAFSQGEQGYRDLLAFILYPNPTYQFRVPNQQRFLVDLHFMHPTTPLGEKFELLVAVGGHKAVWRKDDHDRFPVHMGTVAFERAGDRIEVVDNHHLSYYRGSQILLRQALSAADGKRHDEAEKLLKQYLEFCPSDPRALTALGESYLAGGALLKAGALVNEKRVFLNDHPKALAFMAKTERRLAGESERLLDERDRFKLIEDPDFAFVAPTANDTVAGEVEIEMGQFHVAAPILRLDLTLNGELLTSLYGPPYKFTHSFTKQGRFELEATAWFFDRTKRHTRVAFKALEIGAQENVNLVTVRAIVIQNGRKFLSNLAREDFQVIENGIARPIVRFTRNKAPLNVAILLDTSGSMGGEKIYSTQFAVSGFLAQLEARDRAAIYTFDQKVLRHSKFTNDYAGLSRNLNTLSPQSVTSLYDAIMTAHKDLMQQRGTKAIIVVSDGRDTSSSVTFAHLKLLLADSQVMLYPIHITDARSPQWTKEHFATLVDLASATGCVAAEVEDTFHLDQRFQNIYQELKSFYLLNFYTRHDLRQAGMLDLFVKRLNAKARFRPFQGKLDELFDTGPKTGDAD